MGKINKTAAWDALVRLAAEHLESHIGPRYYHGKSLQLDIERAAGLKPKDRNKRIAHRMRIA